jgi:flagella synthesis protein FlgN
MLSPKPVFGPAELQRTALLIEAVAIQLKEFIALLAREEALLVNGDIDALAALTHEKSDRHRQLQRLNDDRALLLAHGGMKDGDANMRRLLARLPRVLARWEEVLELARQARERNAINGQLIAERMCHNQGALTVLLTAANHPQLYDAGGHSRPTGGRRMLGSA